MIVLITGLMASGKSTVAQLVAEGLPRAVHLRGDVFRRMIVTGRQEMRADPTPEALAQLRLRYRLAADAARTYAAAGFTVVLQDNYYGPALPDMLALLAPADMRAYVLCPDAQTIAARELARGKTGYTHFMVADLYADFMAETPRLGTWIDSSAQTPRQTAQAILADIAQATAKE